MKLEEFNNEEPEVLAGPLGACAPISSWAEALIAGRPYSSLESLLAAADSASAGWSDAEVTGALAHHPRIGERPRGIAQAEAAHSSAEQSGVTDESAWVEANRRYEERFGVIFLIRAAGRTQAQMLEELERRLTNEAADEDRERTEQLRQITSLRLKQLVTP